MKGLLKTKSAWNQFLIMISITLVSFFLLGGVIGMLILSSVTGLSLQEMMDISTLDFSKESTILFLRGMQVVQFITLFVIPVFFCARLFSTDTPQYLGLRRPTHPAYFFAAVGVMFLAIPLTGLLGEVNRHVEFPRAIENWMKEGEDEASRVINGLLSRHTLKDLLINLLCVAGLAAVGEELLFRGVVQRLLIKMFKSPLAGIIVTSVLFSAIHMQFYGFLPRLLLGVLLGSIYWYSGSLWAAILAHFLYDALIIVVSWYNPATLNEEGSVQISGIVLVAAVCTLVLLLLLVWMKKNSATTYQGVYADDAIPVKDHPF
jgi:uncharacterized protein